MLGVDSDRTETGMQAHMFGLRVCARSSAAGYADALKVRFSAYSSESPIAKPDVDSRLALSAESPGRRSEPAPAEASALRLGRHLHYDGSQWVWRRSSALHGMEVRFRVGERLEIEAAYRTGRGGLFGLFGRVPKREFWGQCANVAFLLPTLAWAFRKDGWAPVHASALAIRGRGVLIAGMAGCGKTTLALSMLGMEGAAYQAENLSLVRGRSLWGLLAPLRLDRQAVALVGPDRIAEIAEPDEQATAMLESDRSRCYRPRRVCRDPAPLCAIIFPRLGPGPGARRLSPDAVISRLRLMESLTYEMDGFWKWARVLDIASPVPGGGEADWRVPSDTPAFDLTIKPGMSAAEMRDLAARALAEAGI